MALRTLRSIVWVACLAVASAALAEDEAQRRAREELEQELERLVGGARPSRVKVEFRAPDEPNYRLEEASFELDGSPLKAPAVTALTGEAPIVLFSGEVKPGKHRVAVRLVYVNATSVVLSDEGDYRWKLSGSVGFELTPGLEVQVAVAPTRDGAQADVAKRFVLKLPAKPVMVGVIDDAPLPDPPKVTRVAVVDAGQPVAAAEQPAPSPPPVVAAETPPAPKEEPTERVAGGGKLARSDKRTGPGSRAPLGGPAEALAKSPSVLPVAEVAAEAPPSPVVVDAGAAEVALAAVTPESLDAGTANSGLPMGEGTGGSAPFSIGLAAVLVIVSLLVVWARRRGRVPTIDD